MIGENDVVHRGGTCVILKIHRQGRGKEVG